MKVAFLIGSLNRGGAETLLLDVLNKSRKLPYEVIMIHRKGGEYLSDFYKTNCTMFHIPLREHHFIRYLLDLRRLLLQQQVDIVHAHFSSNAILGRLALLGTKIRLITTYHGYTAYDASLSIKLRFQYLLSFICSNLLCFVSEYQKQGYEKRFKKWIKGKSHVLYNGINMNKFDFDTSKTSKQIGENSTIKLCMVGNFTSVRSQIVICKAFTKIKRKVDFYFIGKQAKDEEWRYDECVAYCEQHKLSNVHFLGSRGDVPDLLRQMDGFVYSTENDTFGIALAEAMAAGLPTIANDHPIVKEITKDGKWATLFKSGDARDCADKIEDLLNCLGERKAQAQIVAKEVHKKYSIEKHIERLTEIYNSII